MNFLTQGEKECRKAQPIAKRLIATATVLATGFLSACAVGPNYHKPVVQVPTAYRGASPGPEAQAQAASYADLPWWQVFQDSVLQELIRTALKQNYDLQLATERITAARAQLTVTRSNQFPQVDASGVATDGKFFSGGFPAKTRYGTYAADAVFQLDLFGQLRRATEAARAQLLSTEYAQKTEILTLVSDVATDYFALLALDLQLQITRDTVKTQQDAVKLTRLRLEHGVATKLDVLQAQQVLDTANAQIPDLERQIGQLEDALSILLGDYPHGVSRGRPLVEQPIPPEVPAGMSSSLLARRPDIFAAEQNLIAANAEIGVAKAAFFPQISLTGSGGGAAGRTTVFSTLINSNVGTWSYGAQLTQPIFEAGRLRGNLRAAQSQERQQLIAYKQAIQGAFKDVSDALIGYEQYHKVRVEQEITVKDLQDTVDTSLMRYRGGIATYLEVLDGQRSLFSAELTLAQARGNEYQSLVQLYKALGGGWQH
jgi:multidrug efflux system outer membrane protein